MLARRIFFQYSNTGFLQLPSISATNYLYLPKTFKTIGSSSGTLKPLGNLACQYCSTSSVTTTPARVAENDAGDNGIINKVLKKIGLAPNSKTRLRVSSHLLYENVADKINYLEFFKDYKMPNTFNSWFLITELHVWMLLVRSMAEGSETGEDGRFLRNCIVEAMWGDVNTRAKKLAGVNRSQTRQQIEHLSEQFQAALIAYDEGLMSEDTILAAALWQRFFCMNCEEYEQIERMVKYVRSQIQILDNLSRQQFLVKPKIPWQQLDKFN